MHRHKSLKSTKNIQLICSCTALSRLSSAIDLGALWNESEWPPRHELEFDELVFVNGLTVVDETVIVVDFPDQSGVCLGAVESSAADQQVRLRAVADVGDDHLELKVPSHRPTCS
ncbi:hypothetical protein ACLOJK_025511 [Asimina triloba]